MKRNRKGFTLTEIIVVLTIVAILAAAAVPSILGFIRSGQQTNRMNIARTIYLAAQNRLTEMRITKQLSTFVAGMDDTGPLANENVILPSEEEDKPIQYLRKSQGQISGSLYELLAPVVDSEILNDAILIEFNIKTGVVLSAFYSDSSSIGAENGFLYDDSGTAEQNISGSREFNTGNNGYGDFDTRHQGYYGVAGTGTPDELPPTATINIYDSNERQIDGNENLLYAEIIVPATGTYELQINGSYAETLDTATTATLDYILSSSERIGTGGSTGLEEEYVRFYWILDQVGGDLKGIDKYSTLIGDGTANIKVGVVGGDIQAESMTSAHPYYARSGSYSSGYSIQSARHLYNVRHMAGEGVTFNLRNNIDLSVIDNFAPIPSFNGTFNGGGKTITGLEIDTTSSAGLFASVNRGSISHLTLNSPEVTGGAGTGALCGTMLDGTISNITLNNPEVTGGDGTGALIGSASWTVSPGPTDSPLINSVTITTPTVTGEVGTGALIGTASNISVSNTTVTEPTVIGGNYTGGVFGEFLSGTMKTLAVVDPDVKGGNFIGGIAGACGGTIDGLTMDNPSVLGTNNVGGISGELRSGGEITGAYVRYALNNPNTITGTANVGGLVGDSSGAVSDSVLISPNSTVHVECSNGADVSSTGGLVGNNNTSGSVMRSMLLALAPGDSNVIRPIAGKNAAGPTTAFLNTYYLCGTGLRPDEIEYNTKALPGGSNEVGQGFDTLSLWRDAATLTAGNWRTDTTLNEAVVLSLSNAQYPYPFYATGRQTAAEGEWPIVEGSGAIGFDNIAYYEKYSNNTYGIWTAPNLSGVNSDSLKTNEELIGGDLEVVETGYVFIVEEELVGHYFWARHYAEREAGVTWPDTLAKNNNSTNAGFKMPMNFEYGGTDSSVPVAKTSTFAKAIAAAVNATGREDSWVCRLPLPDMNRLYRFYSNIDSHGDAYAQTNRPLDLAYTVNSTSPHYLNLGGYIMPLFAKGLYYQSRPEAYYKEFTIRTPVHFWNISRILKNKNFSGSTNDFSLGTTFRQELDIDFSSIGDGVNTDGAGSSSSRGTTGKLGYENTSGKPIVDGLFEGTYDGQNHKISNIKVTAPNITTTGVFSEITVNGVIKNVKMDGIKVNQNGNEELGILVGLNKGLIENCVVSNSSIDTNQSTPAADNNNNTTSVGGITGLNTGTIRGVSLLDCNVSGGAQVGGITGVNAAGGVIESCFVGNKRDIANAVSYHVVSGGDDAGGIVGENTGKIMTCGVSNTAISATGTNSGGIAGKNTGDIVDTYYTFFAKHNEVTIKAKNTSVSFGGIVGMNTGNVERALFLAPAPSAVSGGGATRTVTIYPIVGVGSTPPKTNTAIETSGGVTKTVEKNICFYLYGSRYSLDGGATYINSPFNRSYSVGTTQYTVTLDANQKATGMITNIISALDWLNWRAGYDRLDGYLGRNGMWYTDGGYPYLRLKGLYNQDPDDWVITDSPARLDQVDTDDWGAMISGSDERARNIEFVNGDFELPLTNNVSSYNILKNASSAGDANGKGNLNTPSGPFIRGSNDFWVYYDMNWVPGWYTRPVSASEPPQMTNGMDERYAIEFQQPSTTQLNGRTRTDYKGGAYGLYAELNAQVQGTLYQRTATTPGSSMYYSFYHAMRTERVSNGYQHMNFYLSGWDVSSNNYISGSRPTIMRPCITPRNTSNAQEIIKTVVYGRVTNDNAITVEPVSFYDPVTKQVITKYLYDVWISGLGYGITFWSDTRYTIGTGSGQIPSGGVASISSLPGSVTNDRIIGYWHVKRFGATYSDWKQYYGLYSVPVGQNSTEFAYESQANYPTSGNYVDGITFQAPGFLSVGKNIKTAEGAEAQFVKPEDVLTVELTVQNWGTTPTGNIVLIDRLDPFTEYIEYVEGSARIKGGAPLSAELKPDEKGMQSVYIPLGSTVLQHNEKLTVTFNIQVRKEVYRDGAAIDGLSTLLYYFRNQGKVSYTDNDDNLTGYGTKDRHEKINYSGPEPVKVSIDPIQLNKTLSNFSGEELILEIGDTFDVTLDLVNTQSGDKKIVAMGIITDIIPKGFALETSWLDANEIAYTITPYTDGSKYLMISDANLGFGDEPQVALQYQYSLMYEGISGDGLDYGVVYTGVGANYKYLYEGDETGGAESIDVLLNFPQRVVGLKLVRGEVTDSVTLALEGDGKSRARVKLVDQDLMNERKYSDNGYDVTPEVVLCDASGVPLTKNSDNNYFVSYGVGKMAQFIESENTLEFIDVEPGTYTLHYRVLLTATKPEATPESLDLSSDVYTITITVS